MLRHFASNVDLVTELELFITDTTWDIALRMVIHSMDYPL